jgi:hypothetical protein
LSLVCSVTSTVTPRFSSGSNVILHDTHFEMSCSRSARCEIALRNCHSALREHKRNYFGFMFQASRLQRLLLHPKDVHAPLRLKHIHVSIETRGVRVAIPSFISMTFRSCVLSHTETLRLHCKDQSVDETTFIPIIASN